jgi:hypothetical protein
MRESPGHGREPERRCPVAPRAPKYALTLVGWASGGWEAAGAASGPPAAARAPSRAAGLSCRLTMRCIARPAHPAARELARGWFGASWPDSAPPSAGRRSACCWCVRCVLCVCACARAGAPLRAGQREKSGTLPFAYGPNLIYLNLPRAASAAPTPSWWHLEAYVGDCGLNGDRADPASASLTPLPTDTTPCSPAGFARPKSRINLHLWYVAWLHVGRRLRASLKPNLNTAPSTPCRHARTRLQARQRRRVCRHILPLNNSVLCKSASEAEQAWAARRVQRVRAASFALLRSPG